MNRLILAVLASAILLASTGFAADKQSKEDSTTRSVQGAVVDASDKPVDGAVVQLKDTKTLQIISYITKDSGMYHFHGLNPNVDYELKAEYQGASSSSKRLSSFDTRKAAIVNLKLNK
jgi:hypothetical protein